MASLLNRYIVCMLVSTLAVANPVSCLLHDHKNAAALFVMGDSLFDIGNNIYWSTSGASSGYIHPYGETFFHHPTGRISDGLIVPDFIALFAELPLVRPYLQPGPHDFTQGTNFASAGSGVLPETSSEINLPMQLTYFKNVTESLKDELGDEEAQRLLGNAVYLFSIGGNDYFSFYSSYPNATESQQQERVEIVIGNLTRVLQDIYDLGGRKFAFQNAGAIGCLPLSKNTYNSELSDDGCVEGLNSLTRLHNTALASMFKELESQNPGLKYSIFKYYDAIWDRVHYPARYGFTDGSDACCGTGAYRAMDCGEVVNGTKGYELCSNPGDYLWFDSGHTTESANLQLAKLIWSGTPDFTGPYNVKQLFGQV